MIKISMTTTKKFKFYLYGLWVVLVVSNSFQNARHKTSPNSLNIIKIQKSN
jgi:hypothetical protein